MKFRQHTNAAVELNLTPLIDVVFLLLIFFMVSTTFQKESQIKLQLPEASSEQTPEDARIEVLINAEGDVQINGQKLINTQLETVRSALQKVLAGRRDVPLVIRADRGTPYQAVVTAMDAGSQLGLTRISLPTLRRDPL
ncbi:MAG: biopolymer transporter ExbD [Pseudomonadota bacterium]